MILMFNIGLDSMTTYDLPVDDILAYLNLDRQPPTPAYLDALIAAYTRAVPWESASRIAKRATTADTADCPRFPSAFWKSALRDGTGGTCFESNYAFFALLQTLGFSGYLTINDMNENVGCHTAIIVQIDDNKLLVDAGLPLYAPIPLDPTQPTQRESDFHTYTATPQTDHTYTITRDRHPSPYCFTLIDTPIDTADYRAATTADYGADGLFLDRVIVNRVVAGEQWRFSGDGPPYHLERFSNGDKTYYLLGHDLPEVARRVADRFALDADIVLKALEAVSAAK